MQYCRELKFEETPDYDMLEQWIKDVSLENSFVLDDGVFDWAIFQSCKDVSYTQIVRQN